MAIKDLKTTIVITQNDIAVITTDTVTDGNAIDTTSDVTLTLCFTCVLYDSGDYDIALQDSDDDITYTDIPAEKLIGSLPATFSAATVEGDLIPTVGVFSNARYVKAVITSSGIGMGDGATIVVAVLGGETLLPS